MVCTALWTVCEDTPLALCTAWGLRCEDSIIFAGYTDLTCENIGHCLCVEKTSVPKIHPQPPGVIHRLRPGRTGHPPYDRCPALVTVRTGKGGMSLVRGFPSDPDAGLRDGREPG
jgi:hypothetical protein